MNFFENRGKVFAFLVVLITFTFLLAGCDSGGSDDLIPVSVTTEVENSDDLNAALNSDVTGIDFLNKIEGDAEINDREDDLVLNLSDNTLIGSLLLNQPSNNNPWTFAIQKGTIDGDLTINDPAVSFTLAEDVTVEGATTIKNVAENTFNNKGKITEVNISDSDGITFNNEGIINGDIEISSSSVTSSVVKITGSLNGNRITVSGNGVIIQLTAKTNSVNLVVNGDNNSIQLKEGADVTVEDNGLGNNEEIISTNSISGTVEAEKDSEQIEVLLVDSQKKIAALDPSEADARSSLDSQNRYVFDDVDPDKDYYVLAYDDENGNGKIDVDLFNRDDTVNITEQIGFYGHYPKPVSVDQSHINNYDIKITKNMFGVLIASYDDSEIIPLPEAEVELYNGYNGDLLFKADNLFESPDDAYFAFFTGLDAGNYYWKAIEEGYRTSVSSVVELGVEFNIVTRVIELFTEKEIDEIFAYTDITENDSLVLASINESPEVDTANSLEGKSVSILDNSGDSITSDIAYLDSNKKVLNDTITGFNEYIEDVDGYKTFAAGSVLTDEKIPGLFNVELEGEVAEEFYAETGSITFLYDYVN
ncbi:hypothetical protein C8C77_102198 [Halanaerobium saccharolyticum]|uniref:Uncharacterized protein n=1 Tax=Halanaerobium saccharolyticum TaxID=43595 RepID=A0A4R7Z946_9FIRM|nr:hypothetical protein [Halanaerobium saccharolyticum]RAK09834.1 hypothetical protein C7958_106104 [Halanaerobium saccharolyticum]TDW07396.1 hypothetical protein C8C77_102198 [Halanaerobium saccharolyticum]TDX61275.1 hypothetical protein C7956_106105 [Halanaerobium saccharolyticum]